MLTLLTPTTAIGADLASGALTLSTVASTAFVGEVATATASVAGIGILSTAVAGAVVIPVFCAYRYVKIVGKEQELARRSYEQTFPISTFIEGISSVFTLKSPV